MSFQPEYIVLFNKVQIRYFGIIIVAAMLIAAWVAARLAKRDRRDPDHVWGALTWAIIPAIVLARLWYIIFPPLSLTGQNPPMDTAWFFQNFFNLNNGAIAIWSGGLSIFGAIIGGLLGAYIYIRRNHLPLAAWLDIAGVAVPLGQAIGRWADYVNQMLYGTVTNLPWGITIDSTHRIAPYKSLVDFPVDTTKFHPLFLYESLWNLLAFVVLLNIFLRNRNKLRFGDLFLFYLMQYAFIRFLLEFLRVDVAYIPGTTINSSQVFCVIVFVASFVVFLYRQRSAPTVEEALKANPTPAASTSTTTTKTA
ncbi:MAG TPA: prolipoprotein diacylglyceryl transferase [Phototrophicaceae bacterium]|nr:prolipoprotein diacylglyceryl transferase [Phototrophicaceae bacterium]